MTGPLSQPEDWSWEFHHDPPPREMTGADVALIGQAAVAAAHAHDRAGLNVMLADLGTLELRGAVRYLAITLAKVLEMPTMPGVGRWLDVCRDDTGEGP